MVIKIKIYCAARNLSLCFFSFWVLFGKLPVDENPFATFSDQDVCRAHVPVEVTAFDPGISEGYSSKY